MLSLTSKLISKAYSFTYFNKFQFATSRERKIPNLHQRLKKYSKMADKYKLVTLIRPPNLRDTNIQFPIKIPIRYRHLYRPTKSLFIDNTKDIKWQRLSPNQILLAFQNFKYLTRQEIITGLQYLSKIQGQQKHDWNEHPWINQAFEYIDQNFLTIKTGDLMKFYHLMKKLNCKNQQFWKKMYSKIQENIYEFYPTDFEYLFLTYYKKSSELFSTQMKQKFLKLMEGRLRQFKNSSILTIFQIYFDQGKIDSYWLQNVFIPLFKSLNRQYRIEQVGQIFRYMMIVGHEKNERLYESLYKRVMNYEYKSVQQVELLEDVIGQIKQIFTSHRVQPYLQFLHLQKQRLKQVKEEKKLQLYEIVKQDLIYFIQKRKLKVQQQIA